MKKVKWGWRPSLWASWKPFGIGEQRPNNYLEFTKAFRATKGNRRYAWRILKKGVCDGCALGTTGMRDWTRDGVHLCNIRLRLLSLNTAKAFDPSLLADVERLQDMRNGELQEMGRLPTPMIRRRGDKGFTPVSWDDALSVLADRLRGVEPQRLAFYLTSRGLPNETYYSAQKAVRGLGSNNIDNAARICHSPSTSGLKRGLGVAATTCSYTDWIGTDLVVFFGSNVANNQPVATKYLYAARKAGTKVAIVNSYREPGMERYWIPSISDSALFGTKLATDFFLVNIGGDIAFIMGALKQLIADDAVDQDFIANKTNGFEALKARVEATPWETLESLSGVSREEMAGFAGLVAEAERAVFVWSMGITQHTFGEDAVSAIINLALTKGFVGREGCGLMPIRGHSGVQGGAEMGAYATALPGGRPVNPEAAAELAESWGFEVPSWPGLTAPQMMDAADRGDLEALWSVGGNWLDVVPEPGWAKRALENVPVRVHHDIVIGRQMLLEPTELTVLLPAVTRYEIAEGCTETSTERRIIFSPEIKGPRIPDARHEGEVLYELARRVRPELEDALAWPGTPQLRKEIERDVSFYAGIGELSKQGDNVQYGGPHLCADGVFPTPTGRASFADVPLPATGAPDGQFVVTTRRGKQFNSIIHEDKDAITGARRDAVLMSQDDATRLGLADGDPVSLSNSLGRYDGRVRIARVRPGNLQVHWPEGNVLIARDRRSPNAQIFDYNAVVSVERRAAT